MSFERMTKWINDGEADCVKYPCQNLNDLDYSGCICGEMHEKILNRLAAYEDTGLMPEEINVQKLRRWKSGETPPDGWYWFISEEAQMVMLIENGLALPETRKSGRPWNDYAMKVYGPIPEPEVEHGT